jgi:hypothetical protein
MSAQVKRFPAKTPALRRSPEQQAIRRKHDYVDRELKAIARKASLLSLALTGVMELHGTDEVEGLRDAADEIYGELIVPAGEVRQ